MQHLGNGLQARALGGPSKGCCHNIWQSTDEHSLLGDWDSYRDTRLN